MKRGVLEGMSIDCDNNQILLWKKEDLGVMSVDYGHTLNPVVLMVVTALMIDDYYYNETN
jgi:hypothetical protein